MINLNNIKKLSLYDIHQLINNKHNHKGPIYKNKIIKLKVFYDIAYNLFSIDFPIDLLKRYIIEESEDSSIEMCDYIGNNLKGLSSTTAPNISVLDSLDLMTKQSFEEGNVNLFI